MLQFNLNKDIQIEYKYEYLIQALKLGLHESAFQTNKPLYLIFQHYEEACDFETTIENITLGLMGLFYDTN